MRTCRSCGVGSMMRRTSSVRKSVAVAAWCPPGIGTTDSTSCLGLPPWPYLLLPHRQRVCERGGLAGLASGAGRIDPRHGLSPTRLLVPSAARRDSTRTSDLLPATPVLPPHGAPLRHRAVSRPPTISTAFPPAASSPLCMNPMVQRRRRSSRRHSSPSFPSSLFRTPVFHPLSSGSWLGGVRHMGSTRRLDPDVPDPTRPAVSIVDNVHLLDQIPLEDVRSFCLVAHVDHGKSSLSSRILELAGNLGSPGSGGGGSETRASDGSASTRSTAPTSGGNDSVGKERIELLDTLSVERQRGITVKASTASLLYPHPAAVGPTGLLLVHLHDTPGHVDFGSEVSRSLSFVQGAALLLDSTKGVQAQTYSVLDKARSRNLPLVVALTKVDLDAARPDHVALSVVDFLGRGSGRDSGVMNGDDGADDAFIDPDDILLTSARSRIGIRALLDAVCERIPAPRRLPDDDDEPSRDHPSILRAQVVDSWYDARGVNCLVQILSGTLKEGDRISIKASSTVAASSLSPIPTAASSLPSYSVQEVGIVVPHPVRTKRLKIGHMGYVRFGLRDPRLALPGSVLVWTQHVSLDMALPAAQLEHGAPSSGCVLYASVHPQEASGFEELCAAVDRLALNDTGLSVQRTSSSGGGSSTSSTTGGSVGLGPGLRVGFQGLLHVEVFRQRLRDEFSIDAVVTPPKVPYTVTYLPSAKSGVKEAYTVVVEDLSEWPDAGRGKFIVQEPMVTARILAPVQSAGAVMELIKSKRGSDWQTTVMDDEQWMFVTQIPWAEVVTDFSDVLKNITSGFGSVDISEGNPPLQEAQLTKVDIFLNSEVVEPLAFVCHQDAAQSQARTVCQKLQAVLPRQQFVTVIQAKVGSKVIASERIKAYRKDVLTKSGKVVGGGDMTRKKKLLEKQKEGKKKMQQSGKVALSQEAFNSVISRRS